MNPSVNQYPGALFRPERQSERRTSCGFWGFSEHRKQIVYDSMHRVQNVSNRVTGYLCGQRKYTKLTGKAHFRARGGVKSPLGDGEPPISPIVQSPVFPTCISCSQEPVTPMSRGYHRTEDRYHSIRTPGQKMQGPKGEMCCQMSATWKV